MKPPHLSWSQINTLARCGEQYRRRYVAKEKAPPGIALGRGTAVHKGVEANMIAKLETGKPLPVDAVLAQTADAFDAWADGEFVIDGEYTGMPVKMALSTAKDESVALAGEHTTAIAPEIIPTAIETRIELPPSTLLPVKFVSILDLIDNGEVIRDTKTTRKSPQADAAHTSDQLTSQDLAFRALYRKNPLEACLDYVWRTEGGKVSHKTLRTDRTKADLMVFVRRANAVLAVIDAEIFLPAPVDSWACSKRFCGYTESCVYFRGRERPTT